MFRGGDRDGVLILTDQQVIDIYNKMVEHYGDALPNPDHCPKEFQHYVRLFTYAQNANPGTDHAPQANS